ncbi:immunity protein 39 [Cardiobacteriaceae bacterium TAE3-ERU3]|nr:immunity protein 39 [Cardiobacteriaceae bacterium TAE3-ERU3]
MSKLNHNKKFVISGISLTKLRIRKDSIKISKIICESLEKKLIEHDFFEGLPFVWIGLSILLGLKDDEAPEFVNISKDYECINLRIEVNCEHMREMSVDEFTHFLERPIYKTMLWICEEYDKDPTFIHQHFQHLELDS